MRLLIIVACLACACGKGDSTKESGGPATKPALKPGPPASEPAAKGVVGNVTLSGALAGTFQWQEPLALRCAWIQEASGGDFAVTMRNDANTFIALDVDADARSNVKTVTLTSGKLHDTFTQKDGGVNITVGDKGEHAVLQVDAVVTAGSQSVTVKGKLELTCGTYSITGG